MVIIFICQHVMQHIFVLLFIALCAEVAWTVAGFGSSSIFLPFASLVLDFKTALLLVAIYHIFWNATRLSFFYKNINKRILVLFGIPSIILTVVGASLVAYIDQTMLKMILWIILIFFATYSLFKPDLRLPANRLTWIIGWGLSGFTAWLIGTGGVLRWAFMSAFRLPKEQYIATIALVALIVDATRIPLYFGQWFLAKEYLYIIPLLFLMALLWSYIGRRLLKIISENLFRRIVLVGIILVSVKFVIEWLLSF